MLPPVAVVIIAWNSGAALTACVASAFAAAANDVIIVDNASIDDAVENTQALYPSIKVIRMLTNCGFAQGCNIGIAATEAPYVLLLNDDVILQPDYIRLLQEALNNNPQAASAIGKLIYYHNNQPYIDSAGIRLDAYALRPLDRGHGEPDIGQYDTPEEIFGPSGAAALYKRSALTQHSEQVFDACLFAYYEDVDLAWRLRNQGFVHMYVPCAIAQHKRRGPAGKPQHIAAHAYTNRYVVWYKNESLYRFLTYAPLAIPWECARLLRIACNKPAFFCAIVKSCIKRAFVAQ